MTWSEESIFMNGDNAADDLAGAQELALRYRCEFINLHNFQLRSDVFKKVPADLMLRYNFVPLEEMQDGRIAIAVADPSQLMLFDEISLLLGKRIVAKVATMAQINEFLNRVDSASADDSSGPNDPAAQVWKN
jgi:type IV pilus assembly protein PilB